MHCKSAVFTLVPERYMVQLWYL